MISNESDMVSFSKGAIFFFAKGRAAERQAAEIRAKGITGTICLLRIFQIVQLKRQKKIKK
jgi:hypothetical protein